MAYRVAVASSEGIAVDVHFGRADAFAVFTVDSETGRGEFVEWRRAAESCGCESAHDANFLSLTAGRLSDCAYVLVARIGGRANAALAAHGLHVIEASGDIAPALEKLNRYYRLQHRRSGSTLLPPSAEGTSLMEGGGDPNEKPSRSSHVQHRIAIASSDGKYVDLHFGHADRFIIVDVGDAGFEVAERRQCKPACDGLDEQSGFDGIAAILNDCEAVFVSRIGPAAAKAMVAKGIRVFEAPHFIEDVLNKIVKDKLLDGPPTA